MDAAPFHAPGDIGLRNAPEPMRSGGDQQWRVITVYVVEMDPDRHHALDDREWWLDVANARLAGPSLVTFPSMLGCDSDGAVLMPAERPIHGGILVKEDGPNGTRSETETALRDGG